LEFIDKRPIYDTLWDEEDFTTADAKKEINSIPYCKIPVKSGTLVVFSNYQMIHRVLKMTCNGVYTSSPDGWASRDFLLFFIVDQSKPLSSTKEDLVIIDDRSRVRLNLFKEQIKPTGIFVPDTEMIISTGNTSGVQVGWLDGIEKYDYGLEQLGWLYGNVEGLDNVKLLNKNPSLNRGISWMFDDLSEIIEEDVVNDIDDHKQLKDYSVIWILLIAIKCIIILIY
jgi:hypothetical protein